MTSEGWGGVRQAVLALCMCFTGKRAGRVGWTGCLAAALPCAVAAQQTRFGELHRMMPSDTGCALALELADVDGDGDRDVLIGDYFRRNRLCLNDGAGRFADVTVTYLPADPNQPNGPCLALEDVDGDGDRDVLVGRSGAQSRLYLNDGAGHFSDVTATHLPAAVYATQAVELVDVDGDSDRDALLANNGQQDRLYLNDGAGSFSDATAGHLPVRSDQTLALALADVDGDGDPDMVTGNCCQTNRLFLNNGAGTFTDVTTTHFPTTFGGVNTFSVALEDLDGDGDRDALIGNAGTQDRLYLNNGTGHFINATSARLPASTHDTRALAVADVDGDGDRDILIGGASTLLYLNDGAGFFADVTALQLPPDAAFVFALDLALADVDEDGDADALIGACDRPDRLYLNDGTGHFVDVTALPLASGLDEIRALAAADVDGDGDRDLLLGNYGQQDRLYLNDGAGNFADGTDDGLPADMQSASSLTLVDVDGDGDRDALIGNSGTSVCSGRGCSLVREANRLYLNDGSGVFSDVTAALLPPDLDVTRAVALVDVDGDGDPDALIGNEGQDRLYLDDGAGLFTDETATRLPADGDLTRALAPGDLDGDGDVDLLVGNQGQDRIYLNDGGGLFTDARGRLPGPQALQRGGAPARPWPWIATQALALTDVDGDGDDDALIGSNGQDRLYLNDGGGHFRDRTGRCLPPDADDTLALAVGDVDGDGDPDALFGIGYSGEDRLYLNDGSGVFSPVTNALPAHSSSTDAVLLADMDGDGDRDAMLGRARDFRLITNLTRELAWRAVPRVGQPLDFDLYGSPGEPWSLTVSMAAGSLPRGAAKHLSRQGGSPVLLPVVTQGVLDGRGRASIGYSVPNDTGLIGLTLSWYARIGASSAPFPVGGPCVDCVYEVTILTGL